MHHSLNKLYNYLDDYGNVLASRTQVALQELDDLYRVSITITTYESIDLNLPEEKKYDFFGYLVTTPNEIEDGSPVFQVLSFSPGRLLSLFKFRFDERELYGTYNVFGEDDNGYEPFDRKLIKHIEIRLTEPGKEPVNNGTPHFSITEAQEVLRKKLAAYFTNEYRTGLYLGKTPAAYGIGVNITDSLELPEARLRDMTQQDELLEDLAGYNVTLLVVRAGKEYKVQYTLNL